MRYYLAIDIGASSGRHILGWLEDGCLKLQEIYRFDNDLVQTEQGLVWDIQNLVAQVKTGMKKCSELNKIPVSVAIDTWGVDYVLTDESHQVIMPVYAYRNARTQDIAWEVEKLIAPEHLYSLTGIQKQNFNTIYQLYWDQINGRLSKAKHFMMIPAYLSYCLCGRMQNEYTNATTTGLVNAKAYGFDKELIHKLGLNEELFGELLYPGHLLGELNREVQEYVGYNCQVVFCPSHDTASAVAACPIEKNDIFISSGTWSLIGCELPEPILSEEARECNFTNEGGIERRFRFLKNYMGMWLFQNIRRNLNGRMSYDDMMREAQKSEKFYDINVNDSRFTAPENMIEAIKEYLGMPELTLGEIINSVYHSLAKSYRDAVLEVEKLAGIQADAIRIVGGGSKDGYLNALTAAYTGKKVTAGPVEATALGNIASQILRDDKHLTLDDIRDIIKTSFNIVEV